MSLTGALSIATSGLVTSELGLTVVSQNVAGAGVAGYSREVADTQSLVADGIGAGVRVSGVTLATNDQLAAQVGTQDALVGSLTAESDALSAVDPALGAVGQGDDLGSRLQAVQSSFSTLLTDPADSSAQSAVVQSATTLAQGINALSDAYGTARQSAQDDLVSSVQTLQTALQTIGSLSDRIVAAGGTGASTADLQNQRNAAVATVSSLIDARFLVQPNGDMLVMTKGGAELPTRGQTTLSVANAQTAPGTYYPGGGLPGVMLGSADITSMMSGGRIGADLALRDTTLPTAQGELDSFAQGLASRFDAQGLTLFSDGQGQVPAIGGPPVPQAASLGFAGAIQVNPAVAANPTLVRDGTHAVAGSPTGASAYTPNPQNLAGFTGMITRVLDYALGSEAQPGVAQTPPLVTGLGPAGTLSAPYGAPATLAGMAQALTSAQAARSANASTALADATSLQATLHSALAGATGVDSDTEMAHLVQLQNAYGANAKIISAVQSMLQATLDMVG